MMLFEKIENLTKKGYNGGETTILDDLSGYQLMSIWGAAVIVGWLGAQVLALTGVLGESTSLGIITLWLIGALVPIAASYKWTQENQFEWILGLWPVAGVTGILLNYAVALQYINLDPTIVFGSFWFAAVGVGFAATTYYVNDWSKKLYGTATVLNLAAAVAILQVPAIAPYYYTLAAAIQGAPMLIHGQKG
jgi:hypothetical protein